MIISKENIKNLVYSYTINGKCADEEFVCYIVKLLVNDNKLDDYVKLLGFDGEEEDFLSEYDFANKLVRINVDKEIEYAYERISIEGIYNSKFEKLLNVNLSIVNAVVHEVVHAYQYKKCLVGNFDVERSLLELSLERNLYIIRLNDNVRDISNEMYNYLFMLENIQNDDLYYISLPAERMANLIALGVERDLAHEFVSSDSPNIGYYSDLRYLKGQKLGYLEYVPTVFVKTINEVLKQKCGLNYGNVDFCENEKFYRMLSKKNGYSLDEKLYYGFPIDGGKLELAKREFVLKKKLSR